MATDADIQRDGFAKPDHERSTLERFFDNFLQEANIKWILMIGVAIVAGCSLMLVTQKWSGWPVTLKFLTILTYTAATYVIAEVCEKRLGLRTTSQVLKLLTIVLIPIGFLALASLTHNTSSMEFSDSAYTLLVMVPATVFMGFAANRIFKHWLHSQQLTFLAAYMLLCLAGALPVVNQTWLAVLFSCGFWLVMTLGVLKVNRHIFWLTEEQRWPRVYGFTPIAILGTQLIALYVTKTLGAVPLHWLGLGFVMLAATILMTTRTIANVFRQRTGDLVRPLPMSLIAPLFIGLLLIATGVLFAFHGFHFVGSTTVAIVPTATIAAILLLLTARDTRHQSFVWAGLILLTIAYQSSPILLGDLVQTLKSTAASSINEQRLPVAFYGLTYLPLLLGFAIASRLLHDRKGKEFSIPLKQYVTGLHLLLLVIALTNLKAAFIVTAISVIAFTIYAVLFRDRTYLGAVIGALIITTSTLVPFLNVMDLMRCDVRWSLAALASLGLVLSVSRALDRIALRFPSEHTDPKSFAGDSSDPVNWIQRVGRGLTLFISVVWSLMILTSELSEEIALTEIGGLAASAQWTVYGVVLASLGIWTLQSRHYACGIWTWCFAAAGGWLWLFNTDLAYTSVLAYVGVFAGVVGMMAYAILQYRSIDISLNRFYRVHSNETFVLPCRMSAALLPLADVAITHFVLLLSVYYLPGLLWATATLNIAVVPHGWPLVMGLMISAALIFRGPLVTIGNVLVAPVTMGIAVGHPYPAFFTYTHLPLIYAITSSLMLAIFYQRVDQSNKSLALTCSLWLYGLVALGFASLSPMIMLAASVALSAIYGLTNTQRSSKEKTLFAVIASGLTILSLAMLSDFRGYTAALALSPLANESIAWMTLGVIAAVALFDHPWAALDPQVTRRWSLALRVIGVAWGAICFASPELPTSLEAALVVAFLFAAINEFRAAVRLQDESHVFGGFALIATVCIWVHLHHSLLLSPTVLRMVLVVSAAFAFLLAKLWTGHAKMAIMIRSLRLFGLWVPFVVSASGLLLSNHGAIETLAVFGSAMILFVYGLTHHVRRYVVASAAIMNLGLCTLWNSLSLNDPQFYLVPVGLTVIGVVELLRRDIPTKFHAPLRYAGALTILVSPCFDILGGSWFHMMSLMVLSVLIILLAIGLRLRALIHTGTAFLLADLAAMVVRSSIDNPGMLWVTGLMIGASVIATAAVCERNREQLLSRIRMLSAELATWH